MNTIYDNALKSCDLNFMFHARRQHQRLFPEDEQARFWISAMTGDVATMTAMPPDLVAGLFDQYASKFDEHLVNHLNYRTPQLLLDLLLKAMGSSNSHFWPRAVDLGCGTGLMGPLLRPHVQLLEGVDLSSAMVEKARERGCYDRLEVSDLVSHLENSDSGKYDLLVAADVFVYIGDLKPVMETAAKNSNPG